MNVKQILKQHQIFASKKLSQNFLHNEKIADQMVRLAAVTSEDVVIEIGTGLGILTQALLKTGCKVITFEKDPKLLEKMSPLGERMSPPAKAGGLEVIGGDFLKFDLTTLQKRFQKVKVVANLPYHLSTEILFHLFQYRAWIESVTVMLQKEVVDRILAQPGTKAYGVLTVMSQLYSEPMKGFHVSKGSFYPVPKMDSSVVQLKMRVTPAEAGVYISPKLEKLFIQVVKTAFQKRRKVISNALKDLVPSNILTQKLLEKNINPMRRVETFSIQELVKLTEDVQEVLLRR